MASSAEGVTIWSRMVGNVFILIYVADALQVVWERFANVEILTHVLFCGRMIVFLYDMIASSLTELKNKWRENLKFLGVQT